MAGTKEIKSQIKSVKNTRKITKAMEMVAASKMRRAQEHMSAGRPYAEKMLQVIHHVARANLEYKHSYTIERSEIKRVGFLIVSTDRGLCGGLNINLFKKTLAEIAQWREQGVEVDIAAIGGKAVSAFRRYGLTAKQVNLGDKPKLSDLVGIIKVMCDAYQEGEIDRLYLCGNRFVSSMVQKAEILQLLPLEKVDDGAKANSTQWDYIYEPNSYEVIDVLMQRYIESIIYQSVLENVACEMSARMVAMKSATDNAGNLINDLQLVYNKVRQAAITQEISEIVAGAAAV